METETETLGIGESGIADPDFTIEIDQIDQKRQAPPAESMREVTIRVPNNIPDNVVYNAWQVGMGTVQRLSLGLMVIAFPSVGKGPEGQRVNTIGKAEMIISKAEDVKRVLDLITVINQVNVKMAEAAKNPSLLLGATIEGKQAKDEALRQSMQAANGQVPLVTAKQAPPNKIVIAR